MLLVAALVLVLLCPGPQAEPLPQSHQVWNLQHSSQVAQPIIIHTEPFDQVTSRQAVPFFPIPDASRRQDGFPEIEDRPTLQVMPGDTVSLVVRPKDKPDQAFVDVASLLSTLQSLAPATGKDGAHHVFLAPPDYPVPAGAQRFHVTYVAPNTIAAPSLPKTAGGAHPPLFVAPLNYNVPRGYTRLQIPTRNVKFAAGANSLSIPAPPAAPQFRQPPSASFRPPPPPPPPVTRAPPPTSVFQPPPPPAVRLAPSPPPSAFRPPPVAPAATFQQTPAATLPASRPSLFDQALTEIRAPASPVPVRQEPLVLAMEEPEFLKLVPKPEAAPIEPNEEEENDDEDESEESTEEAETPLAVEAVESEVSREEPQSEAQQTPEILTVETEVSPAKEDTQKKVVPVPEAASDPKPLFPNFEQALRRRPVANRQRVQVNSATKIRNKEAARIRVTAFAQAAAASASSVPISTDSTSPAQPLQFGQKLRPVKTNALVSPPAPIPPPLATIVSEAEPILSPTKSELAVTDSDESSLEEDDDPLVIDREEGFQTLESQSATINGAVNGGRGRIRFRNNGQESTTQAPKRRPVPVRNRNRPRVSLTPSPVDDPIVNDPEDSEVAEAVETGVVNNLPDTNAFGRRPANGGGRGRIRSTTTVAPTTTSKEAVETEEIQEEKEEIEKDSTEQPEVSTEVSADESIVDDETLEKPAQPENSAEPQEAVPTKEPVQPEDEEDLIKLLATKGEDAVESPQAADRLQGPTRNLTIRNKFPVKTSASGSAEEQPWSPYEAVRQMQTNEGKRIVRPVSQPDRGHTRVQSASPGINRPNGGARVQAGNPRVTVIRKKPLHKVVIQRQKVNEPSPGITQSSSDFGVRATGQSPVTDPAVLPAVPNTLTGRRVPEFRPSPNPKTRPTLTFSKPRIQSASTTSIPLPVDIPKEETFSEEESSESIDESSSESDNVATTTTLAPVPSTEETVAEVSVSEEAIAEEQIDVITEEVILTSTTAAPSATSAAPETSTAAPATTSAAPEALEEIATSTTAAPDISPEVEPEATPAVIEAPTVESVADNAADTGSDDDRKVLGVSTATEVSLMYELCFRGRCIRVHE